VINAGTYLPMIAVLASWRRSAAERPLPAERIGPAVLAGIRYAAFAPVMRAVIVRTASFGLGGAAAWALIPLVARDLVHGGPMAFGLLLGGLGFGAVIGALLSIRLRRRYRVEHLVRAASVIFGLASIVVGFSPWLPLSFAALVVGGAGWVQALTSFNVTVQLWSPRWVVGRTLAIFQTVIFGSLAIGSWAWGHIAQGAGLTEALAASGVLMMVLPLLGLRYPLVEAQAANLEPAPPAVLGAAPDPKVALEPRSGPVVVTIEYRVAADDTASFTAAMSELRRIRRRDGARRWSLLEDLGDPGRWVERFHSPTWADWLRQRHRATVADRAAEERALRFHSDSAPPRVSYLVAHSPAAGEPPSPSPAGMPPVDGLEPE
jgi:hypothetical protein